MKDAPKKPLQTGYWTIEVLPDGGYTVAHGLATTRPSYACTSMDQAVHYILKRARGL